MTNRYSAEGARLRDPGVWRECDLQRERLAVLRPHPTAQFQTVSFAPVDRSGRWTATRLARLRDVAASTRRSGAELGHLAIVLGEAPVERRRVDLQHPGRLFPVAVRGAEHPGDVPLLELFHGSLEPGRQPTIGYELLGEIFDVDRATLAEDAGAR